MSGAKEQRLQSVISLSALINSSLDPLEIRRQAVDAALALLDAEAGSLFLVDPATGELYFDIASGDKGEIVRSLRLQQGQGIAGHVVASGMPLLVPDVRIDPRFCDRIDARSSFVTRNLVCVPVRIKGTVIGALEAVNRRQGSFAQDDMDFLATLADQVAIALENARLYEENSRQLSAMIDQERRHRLEKERLVKDLHDGIGGLATTISLLAEISRRGERPAMEQGLETVAGLSRELIAELRTFMNTLESRELTWQELAAEIRQYGAATLQTNEMAFHFRDELTEPDGVIGMFLYLSLYRLAKEALTNALKHSGAGTVTLQLSAEPACCRLEITDDGCGIPAGFRQGRGMRNMRSRAEELSGTLTVANDGGTRIVLEIPLPYRYAVPAEAQP